MPLPPYIKRASGALAETENDIRLFFPTARSNCGSTAGLHFTPQMLFEVRKHARLAEITLHVGYGTFEPVRSTTIEEHSVSPERFEIAEEAARLINEAKKTTPGSSLLGRLSASAGSLCHRAR